MKKLTISFLISLAVLSISCGIGERLADYGLSATLSKVEVERLRARSQLKKKDDLQWILSHNASILYMAAAGTATSGMHSTALLVINGIDFGRRLKQINRLRVPDIPRPWALLLPHAIPELLSLCLAASGGYRLFLESLSLVRYGIFEGRKVLRDLAILFTSSVVLFLLAAYIEVFVSSTLAL